LHLRSTLASLNSEGRLHSGFADRLVAGPRYKTLNTAGNTRDALASPTQHRVLQRNIWP
jgi:hypothetical protein